MNRRTFMGSLMAGIASLFTPLPKPIQKANISSEVRFKEPARESLRFIKQARFDIIDRLNIITKHAIQKEEDENIFRTIRGN